MLLGNARVENRDRAMKRLGLLRSPRCVHRRRRRPCQPWRAASPQRMVDVVVVAEVADRTSRASRGQPASPARGRRTRPARACWPDPERRAGVARQAARPGPRHRHRAAVDRQRGRGPARRPPLCGSWPRGRTCARCAPSSPSRHRASGGRRCAPRQRSSPMSSLVNAPALWDRGFRGQGVVVANMDTGRRRDPSLTSPPSGEAARTAGTTPTGSIRPRRLTSAGMARRRWA